MFEKLEAILKERNIPIYKLAEALEMPNSKFYAWRERGIIPKTEDLIKIANYLGISPKELL